MPDAGIFAVGDQLAVAGHDLAEALRAAPSRSRAEDCDEAVRCWTRRAAVGAGGARDARSRGVHGWRTERRDDVGYSEAMTRSARM